MLIHTVSTLPSPIRTLVWMVRGDMLYSVELRAGAEPTATALGNVNKTGRAFSRTLADGALRRSLVKHAERAAR